MEGVGNAKSLVELQKELRQAVGTSRRLRGFYDVAIAAGSLDRPERSRELSQALARAENAICSISGQILYQLLGEGYEPYVSLRPIPRGGRVTDVDRAAMARMPGLVEAFEVD